MEIGVLFFLVFFALKVLSQDTLAPLRIDCGSETSYDTGDGILWHTDSDFIKTGQNVQLSNGNLSAEWQISTLRFFPEQNKNCYSLPAVAQKRYFIRAVFCYGNYDGLWRPPSFGLEFDGNKWTTVSNSTTEPQYYELVYTSGGDFISVCLARMLDKQYPFISALELWPLSDDMYATMDQDRAWTTSYRYNYGATESIMGYPQDKYNRKWQPMIPQGTKATPASFTSINRLTAEYPPDSAILDAIEAPDSASSMTFSFNTNGSTTFKYIVLYFLETRFLNENETRSFELYILGGTYITTLSPRYQTCTAFEVNTESIGVSDGEICIQLLPTVNTTLPPTISAIEIYASTHPLVTPRTFHDDLVGLQAFVKTFEQLQGWSGDPCLPSDTTWPWISCQGYYPPRVTSMYKPINKVRFLQLYNQIDDLNLTGYGLTGHLPCFSQMQALEIIDLGNNNLKGPIPEFLGELPNLKLLVLSNNDFSGYIPKSITTNKQLKLDVHGNCHLNMRESFALTYGLAIGLLSFMLLIVASVYFLGPKKPMPSEEVTATEGGDGMMGMFSQCLKKREFRRRQTPSHEFNYRSDERAGFFFFYSFSFHFGSFA